jgi:hypothetical protein
MNIPKSLFDSLQASLNQEARRLCKESAKILKIPEKEILEKILKKMPKITVCEDNNMPYSCPVYNEKKHVERCRKPCILGTGRCINHQSVSVPEPTTQKLLTRIQSTEEITENLWCDESDGSVYNSSAVIVGDYLNNKLTLYNFSV